MHTIVYFSPTGNTKYLANQLKNLVEATNVLELDKIFDSELKKNDHLILMYPIHGFNPPRTVTRFVKNLDKGLYNKVSLIAVGCNESWVNKAVSTKLRRLFNKKDIEIVVDEILAMPLTFVMKFPEDVAKETISNAKQRLLEVSSLIKNETKSKRKVKLSSFVIHRIGRLESPAARMFGLELHAKKNCTSCGICWNNCPELNIKQNKKNKPKFGFSCSMCMRCIYNCPEKAITPYISKFIPIKNGYKLEEE